MRRLLLAMQRLEAHAQAGACPVHAGPEPAEAELITLGAHHRKGWSLPGAHSTAKCVLLQGLRYQLKHLNGEFAWAQPARQSACCCRA